MVGNQVLYVFKIIFEAFSIYGDPDTPLKWLVSHRKPGCRIPGKRLGLVHTLTGTASLGLARILRRDQGRGSSHVTVHHNMINPSTSTHQGL